MANGSRVLEPSEAKIQQAQKNLESTIKFLATRDLKSARKLLKQTQKLLGKKELNEAERLVAQAAEILIANDDFFIEIITAEKNDRLDTKQVDLLIGTKSSIGVLIQVKSKEEDVVRHYFGGIRDGKKIKARPHRIAIAPKQGISPEELSKKLRNLVYAIIKNPKRTPIEWYERKNRQKNKPR